MHELKRHILKTLTLTQSGRYSALKPKSVEGNQFSYHLKQLLTEKYIQSYKGVYKLTAKGRSYADRMSLETFKERTQPKIVTLIVLQNKQGKYLLFKRHRKPFYKKVGFPYGKIHLEERTSEAAIRELYEKTGLSSRLTHRGDIYLTIHDETELITHMLCHVFTGKDTAGDIKTETGIGKCFWASLEDFSSQELVPGTTHIARLLKKHKQFFFEELFLNSGEE